MTIAAIMKMIFKHYGKEKKSLSYLQFYDMEKFQRDQLSGRTALSRDHLLRRGDTVSVVLNLDPFPGGVDAFYSSFFEVKVVCKDFVVITMMGNMFSNTF